MRGRNPKIQSLAAIRDRHSSLTEESSKDLTL